MTDRVSEEEVLFGIRSHGDALGHTKRLLAERDALEAKLAEARVERATRQEVYDLGRSEARKGFAREALARLLGETKTTLTVEGWLRALAKGFAVDESGDVTMIRREAGREG